MDKDKAMVRFALILATARKIVIHVIIGVRLFGAVAYFGYGFVDVHYFHFSGIVIQVTEAFSRFCIPNPFPKPSSKPPTPWVRGLEVFILAGI